MSSNSPDLHDRITEQSSPDTPTPTREPGSVPPNAPMGIPPRGQGSMPPPDPTEYQFSNRQNKYMSLISLLIILILVLLICLMAS